MPSYLQENQQEGLQVQHQAAEILSRCDQLADISEMDTGILRQYLTSAHKKANALTASWMQKAGMQTWVDAVGNQWGRLKSDKPDAKRLIIGSHLDTVPNAGKYDGILGVMLGISLAEYFSKSDQSLPFHLDVVGFCDEEGTRFGTTLIGSKALAGQFAPEWLAISDSDGISMRQALLDFGLDPENIHEAALPSSEILSFIEPHIEQGPVLDEANLSLGIVTAIAGAKRANVTFRGQAGHAGTTPMEQRLDSLAAGGEWLLAVEATGLSHAADAVATVGQIKNRPNAVNVISGTTQLSLDVRSENNALRDKLCTEIEQKAQSIATKRQLECLIDWTHEAPAVPCDTQWVERFETLFKNNGLTPLKLPSGAGHDTMAMAAICPVSMLFLRSPLGISHHPDEQVLLEDVEQCLSILIKTLDHTNKTD